MDFPNIFSKPVTELVINRIYQLEPDTKPLWGKMNAPQMLAHLNVTYELVYENKHKKPTAFMRFMLRLFAKKIVVGARPYPKNARTAPFFIITGEQDFEKEKNRLVAYIQRVQQDGEASFDGKESSSFGKLTTNQWNNLFYKHIDHHLRQFGV